MLPLQGRWFWHLRHSGEATSLVGMQLWLKVAHGPQLPCSDHQTCYCTVLTTCPCTWSESCIQRVRPRRQCGTASSPGTRALPRWAGPDGSQGGPGAAVGPFAIALMLKELDRATVMSRLSVPSSVLAYVASPVHLCLWACREEAAKASLLHIEDNIGFWDSSWDGTGHCLCTAATWAHAATCCCCCCRHTHRDM